MQVQSHFICVIEKVYDSDNTDDKKVLLKNCDEINMLTALSENDYRHEKSLKILDKNKNIVQECIEKKSNIQH